MQICPCHCHGHHGYEPSPGLHADCWTCHEAMDKERADIERNISKLARARALEEAARIAEADLEASPTMVAAIYRFDAGSSAAAAHRIAAAIRAKAREG